MKPNDPYYICPVCGCDKLEDPPYYEHFAGSNEICPCCGFEFGVDDFDCAEIDMKQLSDEDIIKQAHEIYRQNWINPIINLDYLIRASSENRRNPETGSTLMSH